MRFVHKLDLTIKQKMIAGFTVIVLLFIITSSISLYYYQKTNRSYSELIKKQSVILTNIKDIQLLVTMEGNGLYSLLLYRDDITRRNLNDIHLRLEQRISEVKRLEPDNNEISELEELCKAFKVQIDDIFQGIEEDVSQGQLSAQIQNAIPWSKLIKSNADELVILFEAKLEQGVQENRNRVKSVSNFLFLFSSLTVLLIILLSAFVVQIITKPISLLNKAANRIEKGDLTPLSVNRKDELGDLIHLFNHLTEKHRVLVGNMYEQEIRLTRTELKFLQSQINPHFLYNTLDSIYWTAKEHEEEMIGDMAYNLSKFFRLSLQKGKDEFTINETLEHLEYYIRIQQLRFGERFSYTVEIEESCREIKLAKLLIQPLIENAFIHGLEKRSSGGELKLNISLKQRDPLQNGQEAMLNIDVINNGPGISEDRLYYIQRELSKITLNENGQISNHEENESDDLFGLKNVKSRIILVYGNKANLSINSRKDAGTCVTLRVPLVLEKGALQ
jgi:CHASE3 domain sensor protein